MEIPRLLPALILLALVSGSASARNAEFLPGSDSHQRIESARYPLSPFPNAPAGTIDPQLLFSTFIGGINWDEAKGIDIDSAGGVYLGGQTLSTFFPTAPGGGLPGLHAVESFAGRLTWNGTALDYINTYYADVEDWGEDIVVDSLGNAYFAGHTNSSDYPTTPGAYNTTPNGNFDAFVMKFDPSGNLVYSTLLGGGEDEYVSAATVDASGAVFITGATFSDGSTSAPFPTTPNAYENTPNGSRDAFLAVLSPDGSSLQYGTFLGGSGNDHAEAIVLNSGAAVMAGWTTSADFDTPAGGYDTVKDGTFDAFVAALVPGAGALDFWTYLGGTDGTSITGERALALALAPNGDIFLAGSTVAADFPATPGAFDTTFGGGTCSGFDCSDGFAARLSNAGDSLLWATFLGGAGDDSAEALDLDPQGNPVLAGRTRSPAFPVTPDAFDTVFDGTSDAFVTRLAAAGDTALYSTFLGGSLDELANDLAISPQGWIYVTGWSDSPDFPTTPGSYDPNLNAAQDVFVTALTPPNWIYLPIVIH